MLLTYPLDTKYKNKSLCKGKYIYMYVYEISTRCNVIKCFGFFVADAVVVYFFCYYLYTFECFSYIYVNVAKAAKKKQTARCQVVTH